MSRLRMLHVEDERNARLMLSDLLGEEVELVSAASAEEGLEACRQRAFDLTLLDWQLPGLDGGAFLQAVRADQRAGRVVVLTALGTVERAVAALKGGAWDFLVKPADPEALLRLVQRVARAGDLVRGAARSRPRLERAPAADILGTSAEVLELKAKLELVAASDAPVLVVGESGTGKELVARALHEAGPRHRARLVALNCAAIPEALFESELFGHARGAFTGADAARPGLMELADGGTLFLDEVGELSPPAQAKLLRALQDGLLRRIGEREPRKVDARVIAATNRDLELEVERGAFRQDLLFRLDVVRLDVPPLRERQGDVEDLLRLFLARHAEAYARPAPSLDAALLAELRAYDWPGNIRQLQAVAQRLVLLGPDLALAELRRRPRGGPAQASAPAAPGDAPPAASAAPRPEDVRPLQEVVAEAARSAIVGALRATGGSRTEAAALLGVSRKTLFNKMQELGIREETHWG